MNSPLTMKVYFNYLVKEALSFCLAYIKPV